MSKPRLLVLTEWFLPGYRAGGPIRSTGNLVAALHTEFDISVVTSDRDLGMSRPYADIPANEWTSHGGTARIMYLSPDRQTLGTVGRLASEADAECVYLNSMFSTRFSLPALLARWRGRIGKRMVVAPRGELLPGALRYKTMKKTGFLSLLRASGVLHGLHFHATDAQERESIVSRLGVPPVRVTTLANVPEPVAADPRPVEKSADAVRLLFLSRVSPKKNLAFLLERLREVPATVGVTLTIGGPQEDVAYWDRCSRLMHGLPKHVRVEAIGAVSHEQVRPLIERHHAFVLPTFGENYGHSIVEALGTGRPVIISDRTPWRNLVVQGAGWDLPLEEPAEFTRAIVAVARLDQTGFDRMARAALAYAGRLADTDALKSGYRALFAPR
ncbi:MAG: glycosyltransferase family 4 protein [Planctomycetia bacterium]